MSASAPSLRYVVLWLTTACNLRCAYCYRGDPPASTMPLEVARSALKVAAQSGLPFHVQMAGGEPTLEPGLMEAIGRMVREAGWPATLAVQTNGTLIDRGLIDLCRRYDISVGLSLDGPPEVQERARGGAAATFRGLSLLARAGIPVRLTTVLSSLNVLELGRLALTAASFSNVKAIGLDPVVLKGRAAGRRDLFPSESHLRTGVSLLLVTVNELARMHRPRLRWREQDCVREAMRSDGPRASYCHACRGESLAVHPDGTVYPCGQTVGDPAMAAGTVDRMDRHGLRAMFETVRMEGDCGPCPLWGRCPGDCPSRLRYNGAQSPATPIMCTVYRTILHVTERMRCS